MTDRSTKAAGSWRVAANTTDTPVVVDEEGRQLGGGEYGAVDTTSPVVTSAVDRGVLVYPDLPAAVTSGPAAEAANTVNAMNTTKPAAAAKGA